MKLVEQILRGNGLGSVGQRSASSGRHPRVASNATVPRDLDTPAVPRGNGETEGPTAGRSPRPRSVSAGRRQQDMQELATVVQELHSKGRVIQNISSSLLQDLPHGAPLTRSTAARGGSTKDGSAGVGNFGASAGGGTGSSRGPAVAAADGRGYGGSLPADPRGRSAGAGISGGGGSGSAAAGKGVTRSILGGVESLTSKLEMLGDRLTPKKTSPQGDSHSARRDASTGRRYNSSGAGAARDGAPNFRELLAAANAGLLQGSGLQDTAQGSRDQRPMQAAAGGLYAAALSSSGVNSQAGALGGGVTAAAAAAPFRDGSVSGGGGSKTYNVGSASAELTASMILQNRRRTSEDIMAADRLLQSLQADIRGIAPTATSDGSNATAAVQPTAVGQAAAASSSRAAQEAAPAADAAAGLAPGEALGSAAIAHHRYGGGMLQSFFASISEAVTPPRSPVAHSSGSGPGPAATPAAPVVPAHVPAAGHGPFAYSRTHAANRHSSQEASQHEISAANAREAGRTGHPPQQPQPERRQARQDAPPAEYLADMSARAQATLQAAAAALQERPSAGGTSATSTAATGPAILHAELGPRLSELQRLAENVTRGFIAMEPEGSAGSAGVSGGGLGPSTSGGGPDGFWSSSHSQLERREQQLAAAGVFGQGRSHGGRGSSGSTLPKGLPVHARPAWPDTGPSRAEGAGAPAVRDATGVGDGRHGTGGRRDGTVSAVPAGDREAAEVPSALPATGHAAFGRTGFAPSADEDGINMALLKQQRRKERERREEQGRQEVAEAAAAASRARQQAVDWQEQHDRLMTQYLATRQRLEAVEAVQERIAREGCSGCGRLRQQLQQATDNAANTAAQLRDVRLQLQDARSKEDTARWQLEQTTATAQDQAAAEERLRTTLAHTLKELLDLAADATSTLSGPSIASGTKPRSGRDDGTASPAGGADDIVAMLESLRMRLREQNDLARRQRDVLETVQHQVAAERSAAAVELADSAARSARELDFQRNRAEGLQEELDRHRELTAKLELRVRQIEDERDRAVRQRDAAELSLEAQQRQLETARQQQDTLVGRMFEAQRAREDAEVLVSQVRSLSQQLEAARAAAARCEALERKVAEERDAKDELAACISGLEAQLKDREGALESVRRHVHEQETTTNSAVASRQLLMEEVSKRSEEVRTLTQENAKMFHHLENLQQEKKKAETQVNMVSSQLLATQNEATSLRVELTSLRDQLAKMQSMQPLQDATFAQHQLSAELLTAQQELAVLRTLSQALGEYADTLKKVLRRHGLPVPEMPSSTEVVSQIASLQSKLAAEAEATVAARTDASMLRQQLDDAKMEAEKLRRELQLLTDKYVKLEAADASSKAAQLDTEARKEAAIAKLINERDALSREVDTLRSAGTEELTNLRSQLTRMQIQVEALSDGKRKAEEDARTFGKDLGVLRTAFAAKEGELERMRLACEDAKAAAEQAEAAQKAAEEQAATAVAAQEAAAAEAKALTDEVEGLQSEVSRLEKELADRNAEYAGLYDYCAEQIGAKDALLEERERYMQAAAEADANVEALRAEVEALRADLADKEQRLLVKPKMADLQYRINELSAQLSEVTEERDAAWRERDETAKKLQDETESHYETDGRRVRLGEEVERLRGILRMYSIPF